MKRGIVLLFGVMLFFIGVGYSAKTTLPQGQATFTAATINPQIAPLIEQLKIAKSTGNANAVNELDREIRGRMGISTDLPTGSGVEAESHFELVPPREAHYRPVGFDADLLIPQTAGPSKEASPWINGGRSEILYAVYEEYDGIYSPQPYLVIVRSLDYGRSWENFAVIYNSSVKYQMPKLVVGEGRENWVYVAYEKVSSSTTVEVARIAPDGSSYSFFDIGTIDGGMFTNRYRPFIATDTDNYYFVYVSYIKTGILSSEVRFARSTDFGASWQVIDVSPDNQGKGFTSIAYGRDGNLYIVTQTADEDGNIWFNKSTDYGYSWGTPTLISTTHKDTYPIISASHTTNDVVVSYVYQYSSSDHDIYYSFSHNSGTNWTTSRASCISVREERHSVVNVDNTAFYLAYWDAGTIKMKKMTLGTDDFADPMNVSDDALAADNFLGLGMGVARGISLPIVIWAKGVSSSDWDIMFDMNPCTPPYAQASISPSSGLPPLTVTFTDISRGTITDRQWDLGDGTIETSVSFTHTYTVPGRYLVRLVVSSYCGRSEATYTVDVGCPSVVASINASVTSGVAPLTVNFTDASTGSPTSWLWDFGDGTSSTEQNPTHTYTAIGSYNVTLIARNACGSSSTAHIGIEVTPAPTPIIVVNPSSITFDTTTVGQWISRDLVVTNRGTGTLTISWSSPIGEGFTTYGTTNLTIPPDSSRTIQLFFAPTSERAYSETFTLITNDPFRPTVSIPLRGYGTLRASSGVFLSPTIVNFDSVAVGSAARQRITIRNNSTDVVRVTRYSMAGSGFTVITDDTIAVPPGGYRFITVEFTPTAETAYYETLFVATTAGTFTVLLSGTGYSRMICYTIGMMKLCAEIIGDGRAERNITFTDLDNNVVLTVGGPIAFIDLTRLAGTGIGYFHYADGSSEMCFIGGFDIDPILGRIVTHFSIDTTIYDDTLLGAPFRAGVGVSPVTVDIAGHWWRLSGGIGITRGGVDGEIRIARVRDWFRHDHYELSDFDLAILGGAFTVRFVDLHLSGDTITAGRIFIRARESLIPGLSGTSFFEVDARALRIYHGALVNLDIDLQFPDFTIPAGAGQVINIRRPRLRFEFRDIDSDGSAELYGLGGGGIFAYRNLLPSLGSDTYINIFIMIRREGLDDATLGFHGFSPGIPLGTSGFFITGVEGEVRHLCHPEDLIVSFSCDLRGGPSLPFVGGIVEMTPTVTIDFERDLLSLEGAVRFLRGLTSGRGGFIFMAHDIGGGFGMRGYASVTAGLSSFASIEGGVNVHMWQDTDDAQFHFTGTGYVDVIIHSRVIFWLMPTDELRVGAYAYFGEFRHGGDSGGHWGIKGELSWRPFGIAPSIAWIDGRFYTDAHEYTLADTRRRIKGETAFEISDCEIGNTDINTFVLRTPITEHPRFTLITPSGELITPSSASTTDSLAPIFYAENVGDGYRYCGYVVHGRNPGVWRLQVEGLSSGDTDHPIQVKGFYNPLGLALTTAYRDGRVTVEGNLSNMAGRASRAWVNIYIAPRTSTELKRDGTLIRTIEMSGDGRFTHSFTQDEIGAKGGEYYIYATVEDNLNRFAACADSVNLINFPEDVTPPLPPEEVKAIVKDTIIMVKWDNSRSRDVAGYKVYIGKYTNYGAHIWTETVDIGNVNYYEVFNSNMVFAERLDSVVHLNMESYIDSFALGVSAYDASGNESEIAYASVLGRDGETDTTPPRVTFDTPAYDFERGIMMVFWDTPDADVRGFILELGFDTNNVYERIELPASTRYYTFEKLVHGVDYFVRIRAYDNYLNISEPAMLHIPFYYESDRDGDGLPDWWERYYFGSVEIYNGSDDPDGDLVINATEYARGTNPNSIDTDGDHLSDYIEITNGELNPLSAADNDGDRIADDWELYYFGAGWDPKLLPITDSDGDGIVNLTEYGYGINPLKMDTDDGGVSDGDELQYGTNPLNPADDFYPAFTITLHTGWNLVSIPVRAYDNAVNKVFPFSIGTYIYNTASRRYESVIEIEPGKSYFVLSPVDTSYTILSLPVNSYTIDIQAGWNMIGSVYGLVVPFDEITVRPDGIIIPNTLYRYDPRSTYIRASTIEPGIGYWILSLADGQITVGERRHEKSSISPENNLIESAYREYGYEPPAPPSAYRYTVPKDFALMQNYPNPFNGTTTIEFALPKSTSVTLSIYNMLGEKVRTLVQGDLSEGFHRVIWDTRSETGKPVPSGIYLYKLETPSCTFTKRMLYLK